MGRKSTKSALSMFVLLTALNTMMSGCEMIRSKVCVDPNADKEPKLNMPELTIGESPEPGLPRFLYARARYFPNPTVRQDSVPVLHMCWYLAESAVTFATPSEFEIAMQTNPAVAKVTQLYQFYTAASELGAKLKQSNESSAADVDKSGMPQLTLVMGDLDRLALGLGSLIHAAPVALVALSYFGGDFAQLKNDNANLTKRAIASQLSTATKTQSPPPGNKPKGAVAATGELQILSPVAVDVLEKNLRSWGTSAPPEAILRLPIEVLVDFACPEY
jgi:hypothetical protein